MEILGVRKKCIYCKGLIDESNQVNYHQSCLDLVNEFSTKTEESIVYNNNLQIGFQI